MLEAGGCLLGWVFLSLKPGMLLAVGLPLAVNCQLQLKLLRLLIVHFVQFRPDELKQASTLDPPKV